MTLSIIIVNYNVKYFLEHCLCAVQKAIEGIDAEILVIDNCSTDNSLDYLKPLFKNVVFVESKENIGYGKANNLGLQMAKGKYVLFLNPDTLIQEDSLQKCISFFENDESVGAMGVRMIDGSGRFLKESKRSFPSPIPSLYKLFGLSALFPHSSVFSKYHLGHLSEHKNHEVDVLCGAFMMVRKNVLDKTGGFDKDFFMYGEDIDLSYRIQEQGYKNYYLADTTIIHFKGESTNKGSLNYVKMFYEAMEVFAKKHYGGARKSVLVFLLQVGIWFRALLSILSGFIKKAGLPVIDAGVFIACFWAAKSVWNGFVKTNTNYPENLLWVAFSAFTLLYVIVSWFWGLYDKAGYRSKNVVYASAAAIVVLLAIYSLLPEHYRFSRGIILLGSIAGFAAIFLLRLILISSGVIKSSLKNTIHYAGLVAGSVNEHETVLKILQNTAEKENIIGRAENLQQLRILQQQTRAKKIIFADSFGYKNIIMSVNELPQNIRYRFYNHIGKTIIGSHSKNESGVAEAYNKNYRLNDPFYRRTKRLFDILSSLLFIITFPIHLFLLKYPGHFFVNCFAVLLGQKTWIGYTTESDELLPLKPAVIFINGATPKNKQPDIEKANNRLDEWYAREYSAGLDLNRLFNFYKRLDEK